jgi:Lon protease-like protein
LKSNPFTPKFESLPEAIPIFPLAGAVLLPGAQLPLNIFEPRYLNMTFDALGADRTIGMIQPVPADLADEDDAVYKTGCAGRVTAFKELDDGRLLIILSGVCRYDVAQELPTVRGYRRVRADWGRFAGDLSGDDHSGMETAEIIRAAKVFLEGKGIKVNWEAIGRMSADLLVNYLAMNLPFDPEEKQALVEAVTPSQRAEFLIALCSMNSSSLDPAPNGEAKKTRH